MNRINLVREWFRVLQLATCTFNAAWHYFGQIGFCDIALSLSWYDFCRNRKIALFGELAKWIPVSPKRISDITLFGPDLQLTWRGKPNEVIEGTAIVDGKLVKKSCRLSSGGMSLWGVLAGTCQWKHKRMEQAKIWQLRASFFSRYLIGPWYL